MSSLANVGNARREGQAESVLLQEFHFSKKPLCRNHLSRSAKLPEKFFKDFSENSS